MENEELEVSETETSEDDSSAANHESNPALWIALGALILWFGFQSVQLWQERANLRLVKANQENAIQEAEKVKLQFQGLIKNTSELANQGHSGARMIINELQKRGVDLPAGGGPVPTPLPAK